MKFLDWLLAFYFGLKQLGVGAESEGAVSMNCFVKSGHEPCVCLCLGRSVEGGLWMSLWELIKRSYSSSLR